MRIPIESSTSYRGRHSRPNWLILAAFVGAALAAGAVGVFFAPGASVAASHWYLGLAKPGWTPPNRWLGPVWTVLYVSMGTSAWLVWRERYHRGRSAALAAYTMQLLLNAAWAPLFFGARNIGAGLFIIVALWLAIVWTLREFAAVKAAAAWLLVPYLVWVSFASALNFTIWKLNP
ncbi:MAG TPA: TspO/MBR family protein [Steroidobacteraceae bacterium]|nr:TspO/MBR family protein [Steroidobacteraceae bacterium]